MIPTVVKMTSNYRFTPNVAGKYYVYSATYNTANASSNYLTTNHIIKWFTSYRAT